MNERLQELALLAWQSVNDQVRNQKTLMPDTEISQDDITDIFEEKFVQLIVRQCGYYADIFESLGCPGDMDPTETKPSDFIKKQFGVEE